jgi:copper chaperone CopZ
MESVKIKKDAYLVEGMTCSGCERTVSKIVGNIAGVQSAKADFKSSTLSVEYDPGKVSIDQIKSAVNGIGYKFVGERPVHGQKEGRDDAVS